VRKIKDEDERARIVSLLEVSIEFLHDFLNTTKGYTQKVSHGKFESFFEEEFESSEISKEVEEIVTFFMRPENDYEIKYSEVKSAISSIKTCKRSLWMHNSFHEDIEV